MRAFARWQGNRSLLINLEGHGREQLFPDIDHSRTIGWFTSLYPVYLKLGQAVQDDETIKTIKEQLRQIPKNGIGYGILRYLYPQPEIRQALKGLDQAAVTFNYLGQFDQALPEKSIFKPAQENKGTEHHPYEKRTGELEITCAITAGRLNFSFNFSSQRFRKESITELVNFYKDELIALIKHCLSPDAGA